MKQYLKYIVLALGLGIAVQAAQAADPHGRLVCGVNERNEIWCTNYWGMQHGEWFHVPGTLKQVIVRDGQLWGVNPKGEIWYTPDIMAPQWIHLQGRAKEISEGHGLLCHVNDHDEIWCADKGITSEHPEWHRAPDGANLKFISVN